MLTATFILLGVFIATSRVTVELNSEIAGNLYLIESQLSIGDLIEIKKDVVSNNQEIELDYSFLELLRANKLKITVRYPMTKQYVLNTDSPLALLFKANVIEPECWCAKEAYRKGGLELLPISDHVDDILENYLPTMDKYTVRTESYLHQAEIGFLYASARPGKGETGRWDKERRDKLWKDYRKRFDLMFSTIFFSDVK